jgi:hypothetical protein
LSIFVVGINPEGPAATDGRMRVGDELLEVRLPIFPDSLLVKCWGKGVGYRNMRCFQSKTRNQIFGCQYYLLYTSDWPAIN